MRIYVCLCVRESKQKQQLKTQVIPTHTDSHSQTGPQQTTQHPTAEKHKAPKHITQNKYNVRCQGFDFSLRYCFNALKNINVLLHVPPQFFLGSLLCQWLSTCLASQMVQWNLPASAEDARDTSSILGSGRSPVVGNGNPLQYSCLENSRDRGTWRATVHGVVKSQIGRSMHPLKHMPSGPVAGSRPQLRKPEHVSRSNSPL